MAWQALLPVAGSILGGVIGGRGQQAAAKEGRKGTEYSADIQKQIAEMQLAPLLAQLRGKEAGQLEALGRASDMYTTGERQFMQETKGLPKQISSIQKLIRQGALPEQSQALSRGKLALSQAGVRGPEAALMSKMQASQMGENLARAVQEVSLREALRRGQSREEFAKQKALTGMAQTLSPIERILGLKT